MNRTRLDGRLIPALLVKDLERTRAFYEGLGFEVSGIYPDQGDPVWLELRRDQVLLQFHDQAPVDTPKEPVFSGTLYLFPDDVDALAAEFRGKVDFAWGPETMDYGLREFGIRDPDGYHLAFAEPDA